VLHVDPVEQHRERRGIHFDALGTWCDFRKAKSSLGKTLVTPDRMQALRTRRRVLSG